MAWRVTEGGSYAVQFEVRSLNDTTNVSGLAGTLVGQLLKPDGTDSGLTVTFTEVGSGALVAYEATGGPLTIRGTWRLIVTEPSGTAAERDPIWIEVVAAATVQATGALLTTLARVKERWRNRETGEILNTALDPLLNNLISEASDHVAALLGGRLLPEQTHTEYLDGDGSDTLYLAQGPIVSVTSVSAVEWITDGAGGRTESLTLINPEDYVPYVVRSRNEHGRCYIRKVAGIFYTGVQNYKVVYPAGYNPLPEGIVRAVTMKVVQDFSTRLMPGLKGQDLGDGEMSRIFGKDVDAELERALAPWMTAESFVF